MVERSTVPPFHHEQPFGCPPSVNSGPPDDRRHPAATVAVVTQPRHPSEDQIRLVIDPDDGRITMIWPEGRSDKAVIDRDTLQWLVRRLNQILGH